MKYKISEEITELSSYEDCSQTSVHEFRLSEVNTFLDINLGSFS